MNGFLEEGPLDSFTGGLGAFTAEVFRDWHLVIDLSRLNSSGRGAQQNRTVFLDRHGQTNED